MGAIQTLKKYMKTLFHTKFLFGYRVVATGAFSYYLKPILFVEAEMIIFQ